MQLQLEQATELREAATLDAYRAQQQVEQKDQQVQQKDHQIQQKDQQIEQKEHQVQQKEHRHQVWSSTHAFTMLRLNNPEAKLPYYAVRCKRGDMSGAIKKARAKHPNSIMVYQNTFVPTRSTYTIGSRSVVFYVSVETTVAHTSAKVS